MWPPTCHEAATDEGHAPMTDEELGLAIVAQQRIVAAHGDAFERHSRESEHRRKLAEEAMSQRQVARMALNQLLEMAALR